MNDAVCDYYLERRLHISEKIGAEMEIKQFIDYVKDQHVRF